MAFCPSCGAPVEGKFCAKCGAPVAGGPPAPAPGPAAPPPATDLAPNIAATLSYIPVLIPAILFLVWSPYNKDKTIRFHAFQSLFLQIAWFAVWLILGVVVSAVSGALAFMLGRLLNLVVILVAAYLMWKTYQNQKIVLPFLGNLAEKQA